MNGGKAVFGVRPHLKILVFLGAVLFGLARIHDQHPSDKPNRKPVRTRKPAIEAVDPELLVTFTVQNGETLEQILGKRGFSPRAIMQLSEQVAEYLNPRRLRPGQSYQLIYHPGEDRPVGIEFKVKGRILRAEYRKGVWHLRERPIPYIRQLKVVAGEIHHTFYQSALSAGLAPIQIIEVAEIFQYDIDFFADIRDGDRFAVVFYETVYRDGHRHVERVLAARMFIRGRSYTAFAFKTASGSMGYFDDRGRPLRKMFLRAPLQYRRISSGFSYRRRHPITRRIRPHLAVDYVAASGTPVVAVGSGRVVFAGWKRGYGRLIEIRHRNGYRSRYAHLRGFARGIRRGVNVIQGQVIGYVGATGTATGPHLHFEMLRYGRRINFLAMKIPPLKPLGSHDLARFREVTAPWMQAIGDVWKRTFARRRKPSLENSELQLGIHQKT